MPITKAEAQGVTRAFVRDYPGALELAYKFREDAAELYGPRAAEVPADMKGGYVPKETLHAGRAYRGRVDVPLQNVESASDLLMTLRHEVLGHYGANTFAPGEKRALLDGLAAARNEPTLKPLWDDVNRRYAGQSLDVRAEEVFALHCEGIEPSQHQVADQVQQRGQQSFTETCIARVRPMQADDLHNIVCMVAQGLRDRSRTQQNFPQFNELFRRDENMEPKKPFHEVVAEKLIEQLKAGTAPWQKPWEPGEPNAYLPMNPTTGKRYKGINAIHLMAQGRSDARWMTYKQAAAVGAQVRKGEKGTPVQYWKFSEEQDKLDDSGRPVLDAKGQPVKETVMLERPRVFFATVFNGEQIDGLPPLQPKKEQTWNAVERAEHILKASGATITHAAGDRAFYRPSTDSITLPERGQFPSSDRYYATALHELGHWTGHASRLDRDLAHPFGSEGYAKEELRAEIASMIVGDELGIGHDPGQHAAYVGSWIKALQDEPLEVFRGRRCREDSRLRAGLRAEAGAGARPAAEPGTPWKTPCAAVASKPWAASPAPIPSSSTRSRMTGCRRCSASTRATPTPTTPTWSARAWRKSSPTWPNSSTSRSSSSSTANRSCRASTPKPGGATASASLRSTTRTVNPTRFAAWTS
jgi:putative DNA primase/helicase